MKIKFITNFCPHYRVKLFEKLNQRLNVEFLFFSEGKESFWNKKIPLKKGDFNSFNLKSMSITKKIKLVPGLFPKLFDNHKVVVKCIGGRLELPLTFMITKLQRKKFILWTGMWDHPHTFFHKLTFPLTRYIYKKADAIVVYGTHVKDYLKGLGVDSEKIFIGWQTVDNSKFNKEVEDFKISNFRDEMNVNSEDKMILCISRLVEEKGIKYLIEAVSKLNNPNVKLTIIGNGELEESLQLLAQELNVNLKIISYIPNDKIVEAIASCDLFVLPSITTVTFKEPWGLVVNEVMNQGKAIIVTDAVGAGVGGLIENNENGIVIPEKDSNSLAKAINKVVENNEFKEKLEMNSKSTIEGWTYEKMATGFLNAIEYVLKK